MRLQHARRRRSANWFSDMRALLADATIGSNQTHPAGSPRVVRISGRGQFGVRAMQQQQDDLLDPGRARFWIGRDGDVRGSEWYRRVQPPIFAGSQRWGHGQPSTMPKATGNVSVPSDALNLYAPNALFVGGVY